MSASNQYSKSLSRRVWRLYSSKISPDHRAGKKVDKYGRKLKSTHDRDNLQRFYRLESEEGDSTAPRLDLARGAVLLESSDDEEQVDESDDELFDSEKEAGYDGVF